MLPWDYLADRDTPARRRLIAGLRRDLESCLGPGARLVDSPSGRELYARDLADLPNGLAKALFRTMPLLAVQPRDGAQIATVLSFATERGLPVVPRGISSTAFGGPVPARGGLVLDLSPMSSIGDVQVGEDPTVTVQAGARFGDIEDRVAPFGYTLAVYPSNRLGTVGGWLASGGYGVNALKYGHATRWVQALEVATMDGAIQWLENGAPGFDRFVGTEGQMGVISRVRLQLRARPAVRIPHLLSFPSEAAALAFPAELASRGLRPATVTFLAAEMLHLLNLIHRADHGEPDYLPVGPSLLVYCDDAETDAGLRAILEGRPGIARADRERAGHLWAERYFPMKTRRLGPSLLAGQVVLSLERTAGFLAEARRRASRWGVVLAPEVHILPPEGAPAEPTAGLRALAILTFPTDQRRAAYLAHTVLVSALDLLGSRWGGRPYNLGIWHAPLAGDRHSRERLADLVAAKRALDPQDLLNPGKFPVLRSRFLGLTGLPFNPALFRMGVGVLDAAAPVLTSLTPRRGAGVAQDAPPSGPPVDGGRNGHDPRFHVTPEPLKLDRDPGPELALTALQCTSCGNCISVCPAYLHTHDERTTARGKLWLARRVALGKKVDPEASSTAFLCMRCRACAAVCQAQLPLMDAWEQLETLLERRHGRPEGDIRGFLAQVERSPAYLDFIGLERPERSVAQGWLKPREPAPDAGRAAPPPGETREVVAHRRPDPGGRFHVETRPAPPMTKAVGKYRIERNDYCVNCGHCGEACVYGVHSRNPRDPRRMAAPADPWCRACFRCTQECPRQALSISVNPAFTALGRGPYTDEVVYSLARQADEGRIPVTGAGYRGPFAGEGFDGMWTDMSEIVRPTRDGIHGREYISTAIDIGRRPLRLLPEAEGGPAAGVPPWVQIPIPVLFALPPLHAGEPRVAAAIARAAAELGTFVLGQTEPGDGILRIQDRSDGSNRSDVSDVVERIAALKAAHPGVVVVVTMALGGGIEARVEELARGGCEAIHLEAHWDGLCADGTPLHEALPTVHRRLVACGLRDEVTLLAGGGIAAAEHVPKAIILGADGVVVDLPLLAALECPLGEDCFDGRPCPTPLTDMDLSWARQRIVNLMGSWRNQLLEVLGAMGMREVRRLRGERGRSMLASRLEAEVFAPLFR